MLVLHIAPSAVTSLLGGLPITWIVSAKNGLGSGIPWVIPVTLVAPAVADIWWYWSRDGHRRTLIAAFVGQIALG